MRGRV